MPLTCANYYPDFVARLENGEHWLVETKGAETVEVAHKDRAATLWCENATKLTGTPLQYLKVQQKEFGKLQPSEFTDLKVLQVLSAAGHSRRKIRENVACTSVNTLPENVT